VRPIPGGTFLQLRPPAAGGSLDPDWAYSGGRWHPPIHRRAEVQFRNSSQSLSQLHDSCSGLGSASRWCPDPVTPPTHPPTHPPTNPPCCLADRFAVVPLGAPHSPRAAPRVRAAHAAVSAECVCTILYWEASGEVVCVARSSLYLLHSGNMHRSCSTSPHGAQAGPVHLGHRLHSSMCTTHTTTGVPCSLIQHCLCRS
jgi:hypothetical protein